MASQRALQAALLSPNTPSPGIDVEGATPPSPRISLPSPNLGAASQYATPEYVRPAIALSLCLEETPSPDPSPPSPLPKQMAAPSPVCSVASILDKYLSPEAQRPPPSQFSHTTPGTIVHGALESGHHQASYPVVQEAGGFVQMSMSSASLNPVGSGYLVPPAGQSCDRVMQSASGNVRSGSSQEAGSSQGGSFQKRVSVNSATQHVKSEHLQIPSVIGSGQGSSLQMAVQSATQPQPLEESPGCSSAEPSPVIVLAGSQDSLDIGVNEEVVGSQDSLDFAITQEVASSASQGSESDLHSSPGGVGDFTQLGCSLVVGGMAGNSSLDNDSQLDVSWSQLDYTKDLNSSQSCSQAAGSSVERREKFLDEVRRMVVWCGDEMTGAGGGGKTGEVRKKVERCKTLLGRVKRGNTKDYNSKKGGVNREELDRELLALTRLYNQYLDLVHRYKKWLQNPPPATKKKIVKREALCIVGKEEPPRRELSSIALKRFFDGQKRSIEAGLNPVAVKMREYEAQMARIRPVKATKVEKRSSCPATSAASQSSYASQSPCKLPRIAQYPSESLLLQTTAPPNITISNREGAVPLPLLQCTPEPKTIRVTNVNFVGNRKTSPTVTKLQDGGSVAMVQGHFERSGVEAQRQRLDAVHGSLVNGQERALTPLLPNHTIQPSHCNRAGTTPTLKGLEFYDIISLLHRDFRLRRPVPEEYQPVPGLPANFWAGHAAFPTHLVEDIDSWP